MTTLGEPHVVHQAPAQAPIGASERMPRPVRLGLTLALGGLMAGAVYLVAVRGEALLVDLAALGERLWCF
jgi:hypothetical protein